MAIRAERWLLVGDYLSPCEIPFVDNLADYRRTLHRLLSLVTADIEAVIPGHGPQLSVVDARRIAQEDLRYLDRIARCAERNELTAALNLPLPRATNVVGMREHHQANCRNAGLPVTLPEGLSPD
jgi:glyoxylase-like metal-dependent hydrolase (beta-lactamase superfamily II)